MNKSAINSTNLFSLSPFGFEKSQIQEVNEYIKEGQKEELYSKVWVPYHDWHHIERVLFYIMWIMNLKEKKETKEYINILLLAGLYHDCGRRLWINKNHGKKGAEIVKEKLKNKLSEKDVNTIALLVKEHCQKEDKIIFENERYTKEEQETIQRLSFILKDADALDRNRIQLFKFAQCDPKYLRTDAAKEIYLQSDLFFVEYKKIKRKGI